MSLKKDYLSAAKLCGGPGGWRCPCCNPYHCSPRKMKPLARRRVRRAAREEVRNNASKEE